MRIPRNILANQVFHHSYWWTYCVRDGKEEFEVSEPFTALIQQKPHTLEQFFNVLEWPMVRHKLSEALQKKNKSELDIRFMTTFDIGVEQRFFQNSLHIIEQNGVDVIWAQAVEITEMARFEKEMVDAQGRLSVQQIQEQQNFLQEQNNLISSSYDKQSRFLGLLSHELRSPLLGIRSLVKRIKDNHQVSDDVLLMLATINMTAEQANYLVNDILTYSQTQFGAVSLRPVKTSLAELLSNVKRLTQSIGADKGLMIALTQINRHNWVYVDSVRLTQVLINLIINAIKFTQYGGVNIEVSEPHTGVFHFKVTDSGEGISAEVQQSIFEPFAQIESNVGESNTRSLGAGLGLFVVKELVALMGGDIRVSSKPEVGTSFEFDLKLELMDSAEIELLEQAEQDKPVETETLSAKVKPIAAFKPQQSSAQSPSEPTGKQQRPPKTKILIADDSGINRMVLAGYLHDLHCDVYEAADGRQAWDLFQQGEFDYVLLDIQMPIMDGLQVGQKILHADKSLKKRLKGVFAITAGGETSAFGDEAKSPSEYGFDRWLIKPVGKEQIIELISENFRKKGSKTIIKRSDSELKASGASNQDLIYHPSDIPRQFESLIPRFIDEMKQSLELLLQYNAQNETESIKKMAHYLKGNCMLFQLENWSMQLKTLENLQSKQAKTRVKTGEEIITNLLEAVKFLEKSL
ncbi:ATP-binding protein [Thiomicrorhabdus sediminis]|uniref:histidine kinase n=1 Tax=Thiomicrorhabdus sediminis TaxID=2580412 RepID=A0A4P9K4T4_9GAMM|nr:ATP-binding protein [Thiomicrorhabdus sediminis]QCU89985.1 response regulator [Thiomicrorhabdus sediminis]